MDITIRRSGAGDGKSLVRLAELDSKHVPPGDFLIAEVDGEVPAAVALAVIDSTDGNGNGNTPISDQEIRWLRSLAEGMPVAHLALEEGYSVRSMYRRLARTYRRLGAANRMQALIRAAEAGWLT